MATISIPGRVRQEYQGELFVPVVSSRRDDEQPAWSEFELYLLDNGRWLVHRNGRSLTYHLAEPGHTTNSGRLPGRPGTVEDLPDDAVPCAVCRPPWPDELADDEQIRVETDRHRVDVCATPEDVIKLLATNHRQRRIEVSGPVAELLDAAAQREPRFGQPVPA